MWYLLSYWQHDSHLLSLGNCSRMSASSEVFWYYLAALVRWPECHIAVDSCESSFTSPLLEVYTILLFHLLFLCKLAPMTWVMLKMIRGDTKVVSPLWGLHIDFSNCWSISCHVTLIQEQVWAILQDKSLSLCQVAHNLGQHWLVTVSINSRITYLGCHFWEGHKCWMHLVLICSFLFYLDIQLNSVHLMFPPAAFVFRNHRPS